MGYRDKGIIPARHIGRHRPAAVGIRAYLDPKATLTGTLLTTPTETEVAHVDGQTIIVTLTFGKWVASGTLFNAQRQAILNGFVSRRNGATEWNTLLHALAVGQVVRTSDTVVTVTVSGAAKQLYKITSDEEIRFSLPPTAVELGIGKVAAINFFTVTNENVAVTAALTGTFLTTPTEAEVVTGGQTIIITLTGADWVDAGSVVFDSVRQSIINGLVSAQAEANGWNVRIKAAMAVTTVVRTSATVVTITLPAAAAYAITANETVTVTIPAVAIVGRDDPVVASSTITIVAA